MTNIQKNSNYETIKAIIIVIMIFGAIIIAVNFATINRDKEIAYLQTIETQFIIGKTTKADIAKIYNPGNAAIALEPRQNIHTNKSGQIEILTYRTGIGNYKFTFENQILTEWTKNKGCGCD